MTLSSLSNMKYIYFPLLDKYYLVSSEPQLIKYHLSFPDILITWHMFSV